MPPRGLARGGPRPPRADPVPWDDRVVTLMIRQLPRQYTQLALLQEVNQRGFEGLFDFFYLPYDLNKGVHVGFGFVNFIQPKYALEFQAVFDGAYLDEESQRKGKPLRVHPASVQGYEANYAHFANTKTGQMQDPQLSPLFFPPGTQGQVGSFPIDAEVIAAGSGAPALAAVASAARATAAARARVSAEAAEEAGYANIAADPMNVQAARFDQMNLTSASSTAQAYPAGLVGRAAIAPAAAAPAPPGQTGVAGPTNAVNGVPPEALRELKQEIDDVQEQLVKAAAWVLASAACQGGKESDDSAGTATAPEDTALPHQ